MDKSKCNRKKVEEEEMPSSQVETSGGGGHHMIDDEEEGKSDFYMVLPSNSSTYHFPNNKPYAYSVAWNNAKIMNERIWKVALTEASFAYPKYTLNIHQYMEVHEKGVYMSPKFTLSLGIKKWQEVKGKQHYTVVKNSPALLDYIPQDAKYDDFEDPRIYPERRDWWGSAFAILIEARHRFIITFQDEQYKWVGLLKSEYASEWDHKSQLHVLRTAVIDPESEWNMDVTMQFISNQYHYISKYGVPYNKLFERSEHLASFLLSNYPAMFDNVSVEEDSRLRMQLKMGVVEVKFMEKMNVPLGLVKAHYDFNGWEGQHDIKSDFTPVLNMGIDNLFIYSSACKPINVGGQLVPLLKSIWLDGEKKTYNHGEVINVTVQNPMYLPVASTSINRIDVFIRNVYGKFIPFPETTVTSITLHFRNYG